MRIDRQRPWIALVVGCSFAAAAVGQPAFPQGVASGDVTESTAVCWTRTTGAGSVRLDVARDDAFTMIIASVALEAAAENDTILKYQVTGLEAGARHSYRFVRVDTNEASTVGSFTTAPQAERGRSFRFVYAGDSNAAAQPFGLLASAAAEEPDFWIWGGDTAYGDWVANGLPIAVDLDGYRAKHRQNREDAYLRDLLARSAVWAQWDDHEVANDYDGGDPEANITPQRQEAGYQAFFEYMPIEDQNVASDRTRIYRSFRYGSLAEFFILDCRQYRSRDVGREGGGPDPRAFFLPLFEQASIDRMEDPSRTMLGAEQLAWLKSGLAGSTARWKFVVSSVPFTSLLILPYDRWDGYDAERYDLLRFIDDHGISGVVILSADIHVNLYNPDVTHFLRNRLGQDFSPAFAVREFVAGPIAMRTFAQAVGDVAGPFFGSAPGEADVNPLFSLTLGAAVSRIKTENGVCFFEPDRYAYLVVDVTPGGVIFDHRGVPSDPAASETPAETLHTVTLYDPRGMPTVPCFLFPLCLCIAAGLSLSAWRRLGVRACIRTN